MATRTSLTSRGFTSVNAGVSSTNRFLKAPRAVGEYTTVAQELADLRTAKNAVGPAAQPLRPRARVDAGGGGDGGENIDTSYQLDYANMTTQDLQDQYNLTQSRMAGSKGVTTGIGMVAPTLVGAALAVPGIAGIIGSSSMKAELDSRKTGQPAAGYLERAGAAFTGSLRDTAKDVTDFLNNPIQTVMSSVDEEVTSLKDGLNSAVEGVQALATRLGNQPSALRDNKNAINNKALQTRGALNRQKEQATRAKSAAQAAEFFAGNNYYDPSIATITTIEQAREFWDRKTLHEAKKAANADISAGNVGGSSGSDSSQGSSVGGHSTGVDDSGQATGQDEFD